MAIISKDTTRKQVIDLTGPQGNAFYLLGLASKLCKQLELDEDLAEEILMRKLEKLIKRVRSKFDWLDSVPHEVQGVLVEMSYQMGLSGVSKFNSNGLDLIDTGGRSYTVISFSVGSMVDNLLFNFSFIKIG